jgi:hypothetical protein
LEDNAASTFISLQWIVAQPEDHKLNMERAIKFKQNQPTVITTPTAEKS